MLVDGIFRLSKSVDDGDGEAFDETAADPAPGVDSRCQIAFTGNRMTRMEELNSAATEVAAMLQTHGGVPRLVRALNRQR